jgi:hypothetical protein
MTEIAILSPFDLSTGPEPMELVRAEYLRLRNQQQQESFQGS